MYKYTDINKYVTDVKNNKIKFPLKRYSFTPEEVVQMFERLKKYHYKDHILIEPYKISHIDLKIIDLKFLDKNIIIISPKKNYKEFNQLSDIFQEEQRMKCKVKNAESPYNFFKNQTLKIAQAAMTKYKIITPESIRESIWGLTKECTIFRPAILVSIIQIFNSKSVLDFSSGWGDRLLACLASNVKYFGVDPNSLVHPGYQRMIECFAQNKENYTIIQDGIENVTLPTNRKIDLIFTSPPYFDYEIYNTNDKKQSSRFNNERKWFDNFLKVALEKVWGVLEKNGIMAINIHQHKGENFIYWMIDYCKTLPDCIYLGVVCYTNEEKYNYQPIWIFRKGELSKEEKSRLLSRF